jgi:arylsulfatase A-like enzyme
MLAALAATTLFTPKLNVIYIMADDLGYGELGCYGQKLIPTPNIDRLAAEGTKFTRFYAASTVCAPTRCSLMTGLHQGHAPIRGNKEKGGFGPNDPEGQTALPLRNTTIAENLKTVGYKTAIFGKWGLGGPQPGETPMDHGFDTFYGYLCQRRAHTHYPAYLWDNHQPDLLNNVGGSAHQKVSSVTSDLQEWNSQFNGSDFAHAKILDRAQGFIKKNKENPFFIYYATTIPHAALQAPPEWIEKFPKEWDPKPYLGANGYLPNPRPRATYAAMIAYLDWSVGQLRETLEREGIANRTLIVFTSDNGATFNGGVDTEFFNSNGGLRGKKMSLYEGGIREPFIAWCPSLVPAGKTVSEPFVAYDTLASLSELCGTKAPRNDGISYASALLGKEPKKREYVYVEYPEASAMQAVWIGSFKMIRPDLKKNPEKIEVYDLDSDPSEKTDLAAKRPDLIQRAKQIWAEEHVPSKDFPLGVIDKK